jgi:hypothetical protein
MKSSALRLPEELRPAAAEKHAPIYVTRPDLPDLADFIPYLQEIWDSKVLTNGGPFHQQFEQSFASISASNSSRCSPMPRSVWSLRCGRCAFPER